MNLPPRASSGRYSGSLSRRRENLLYSYEELIRLLRMILCMKNLDAAGESAWRHGRTSRENRCHDTERVRHLDVTIAHAASSWWVITIRRVSGHDFAP
jgi:hypothetical protein